MAPILFGLGVLFAPVVYAALRKLDQAVGAFISRREKYAAGHFVRIRLRERIKANGTAEDLEAFDARLRQQELDELIEEQRFDSKGRA
ncbi:MAG TPA: hypothetical protein VFI17_08535 [Solirubrobacterales bacterium]|nr:hypothetical protein [Solirubrobacterales bacterium]